MPAASRSVPLPPVLTTAAHYGAGFSDPLDQDAGFDRSALHSAVFNGEAPAPQAPQPKPKPAPVAMQDVCDALIDSAHQHNLPVRFFIRLIWQESGFDPNAISRVGAQGMAQFMPDTATSMGLDDPFNPIQALQASARLLRDLISRFGNLGLAAAAYNAGPQKVAEWLKRGAHLPLETRKYVRKITGQTPERWRHTEPGKLGLTVPDRAPCKAVADNAPIVEVPAPLPSPKKTHTRVAAKSEVRSKTEGPKAIGHHRVEMIIQVAKHRSAAHHRAGKRVANHSSRHVAKRHATPAAHVASHATSHARHVASQASHRKRIQIALGDRH